MFTGYETEYKIVYDETVGGSWIFFYALYDLSMELVSIVFIKRNEFEEDINIYS